MISDVQNYNKLGKEQKKIAKIFHNNTFAIDFTVIVYAFPSILRMSAVRCYLIFLNICRWNCSSALMILSTFLAGRMVINRE